MIAIGLVATLALTCLADAVENAANPGAPMYDATTVGQQSHTPLTRNARSLHALIVDETARAFRRGDTDHVHIASRPTGVAMRDGLPTAADSPYRRADYTSRIIHCAFPVNTVIASWNADLPEGTGLVIKLRLRKRRTDTWTPFYYLGSWGDVPASGFTKTTQDDLGLIDIDYFRSTHLFDRVQYRVLLFSKSQEHSPTLRRLTLAVSYTQGDASIVDRYLDRNPVRRAPRPGWARRLDVPFFSQRDEAPEIAGSVCSPISVAMVMAHHGVHAPTAEVCALIWDPEYKIFGNWVRAVQGAYHFGLPGYVQRFGDWNDVKRYIARDIPVIASIRVPEAGMLRGAPYRTSQGHLLVITGFDELGHVHVNDPAGKDAAKGMLTYDRHDMERVWFGHGGVGYVILPPDTRHVIAFTDRNAR